MMKKIFAAVLCLAMLLSLCACGGESPSVQGGAPQSASAAENSAEPVTISELPIYESYMYSTETGAGLYVCYLYFYTQSGVCYVEKDDIYRECTFTEDEKGNVSVTLNDICWNFRRTDTGLELTGGSPLTAYMPENAENMIQISSGSEFTPMDSYTVRAGIYVADISEYTQFGDAPALSLDLTNKVCALRGYDGSQYDGRIAFESDILRCIFPEGQVDFSVSGNAEPKLSARDKLPFLAYPTAGYSGLFTFNLDENAGLAESNVSTLKDSRRLYYERFSFYADGFSLDIKHNALGGTWELSSYGSYENMTVVSDEGDILIISDGTNTWNFRRQGKGLVFESGSALLAYGPNTENEALPSMTVMYGTVFERREASYVYHMLPYIMDISATETKQDVSGQQATQASLLLDTEYQRFIILNDFGMIQQGVLEYDERWLRLHYGQSEYLARPEAHGLVFRAHEFFSPMYMDVNSELYFNPLYDSEPAEGMEFFVDYAPQAQPDGSVLLTEEYVIYTEEDGLMYDSTVVLCPEEKLFFMGSLGRDRGTYIEQAGTLRLFSEEYGHEYIFSRQGESLVHLGGAPMYLEGNIYQGTWSIAVELPLGCKFPLYSRNCLRSGTYQLDSDECSATISIDLDAMSCTLVTTDGTEYTGAIEINTNRVRMEIPEGAFFLSVSSVDGIRVSNLLEAVTIAPELDVDELYFKFIG